MAASLKNLLIMVVIGSMVAVGLFSFITGLGDYYGVTMDDENTEFLQNFSNILNSSYSDAQDIQKQIAEEGSISGLTGAWMVSQAVVSVIKLPFTVVIPALGMVMRLTSSTLGIPIWFTTGMLSIAILIISFLIVQALFRKDRI